MNTTLDEIEKERRTALKTASGRLPLPRSAVLFAAAFFVTPFAVTSALFVPIFGQILCLIALVVSAVYVASLRSAVRAASALLGAAASLLVFGGVMTIFRERTGLLLFLLLTLNIIVMIVYIVAVSGAIWLRAESRSNFGESNGAFGHQTGRETERSP